MNLSEQKPFVPIRKYSLDELVHRSLALYTEMAQRRSIRDFSDEYIPEEVIRNCVRIAGTAPSGANSQPWHFVIVKEPELKRRIRTEAEKVEYSFYRQRATQEWKEALKPLGTDYKKPFLETAPYLIVIFMQKYGISEDGSRITYYYAARSVGIATGFLIAILHQLGISTLTYTPSPMTFLNKLLNRPNNELPYVLLVVGYAANAARVPDIERKLLSEIATFV